MLTLRPTSACLLACQGDDCMHGPYRTKLLEMGAFGGLLRAALTSVMDPDCDMIVQQVRLADGCRGHC